MVDASNPQMDTQMYVVYDTLRQLGVEGKPVITLFNKQDLLAEPGHFRDFQADYTIPASARTGQGLEELKRVLSEILRKDQVYIERLYPFGGCGKGPGDPRQRTAFGGRIYSGRNCRQGICTERNLSVREDLNSCYQNSVLRSHIP